MQKPNNKTMQDIPQADDIRAVLSDVNERVDDLVTIAIVTRDKEGHIRCRFFGSYPETIGLLEVGKLAVESHIILDEEEGDNAQTTN